MTASGAKASNHALSGRSVRVGMPTTARPTTMVRAQNPTASSSPRPKSPQRIRPSGENRVPNGWPCSSFSAAQVAGQMPAKVASWEITEAGLVVSTRLLSALNASRTPRPPASW